MDKEYLEGLENSFKTDDFRKIYVDILKFFNTFDEYKANEEITIQFLEILNKNREKLVFGEKEKLLNETVAEVYQGADLMANSDFTVEKSELFFKKQINDLFSREMHKLTSVIDNKRFHGPLIKLLSFFFNNLQVKVKEQIQELLEYYLVKYLTPIQLKTLINPLFDRFPMESLTIIIKILKDLKRPKAHAEILYQILEEFSEIYPDIYYEYLDFLSESLDSDLDLNYKEIIAQIIYNIANNRTALFILNFFDILRLLNKIYNLNNKKVIYYLEMSLKSIFINNSFGLFEYFKKEMNEDFDGLLNLMNPNYTQINDILNEYYIEYLNYLKVFYHNGKISKTLLEIYLKILEYFLRNKLTNEYFLLSIISQLNLEKFQNNLEKFDNDSDEKELEKRYQEVISEMKNFIELIF